MQNVEFIKENPLQIYYQADIPTHEAYGYVYGVTKMSAPFLNGVIKNPETETDIETVVEKITSFFREQEIPHSWWLYKPSIKLVEHLTAHGLASVGQFPGMVLDLSQIPDHTESSLTFHEVTVEEDYKKWMNVLSNAFSLSEEDQKRFIKLFKANASFVHLTGNYSAKAVTTGTLLITPNGAYIYNVATLVEERKKGFATEMTKALIQKAKDAKVKKVGLVSSPPAISLYTKLGFKEVVTFEIFA